MNVRHALGVAFGVASAAAIGYTGVAIAAVVRFARAQPAPPPAPFLPPVTVLVPLHGVEPELEANLRALASQQYGPYQIVAGVHDPDDPALAVVRRVASGTRTRIDTSIGEDARARNPKIANVLAMMRLARHDTLVLVDSDVRVDAETLRTIVAPLADPTVGMVTCLYTGLPADGAISALGAMFINEQFVPSALVDALARPLGHGYGAAIALRRDVLEEIGGFEAVAAHLADDHWLGRLVRASGRRVVLSHHTVRTIVADRTLRGLWSHELRWHRTIRSVQPRGYAGLFVTYPVPLAALATFFAPRRGPLLLAAALAARYALQRAVARALRAPVAPWLVVPRDALGFATWIWGLAGHDVRWRGTELHVTQSDELAPSRSVPTLRAEVEERPRDERRPVGVSNLAEDARTGPLPLGAR